MTAESMSLRDMLFWVFLTLFGTGTYVIYGSQSVTGEGWGLVMIAAGLIGMAACAWSHLKGVKPAAFLRRGTLLSVLGAVLACVLVVTGVRTYRHFYPTHPAGLAAPLGLIGGFGSPLIPMTEWQGRLFRVPASQRPCSNTRIEYGEEGLENLPGGADLKRPRLLLSPVSFGITEWSNQLDDLLFEIDVTNRGESSIAKDWRLCLVHGKTALYFNAQPLLDPSRGTDLARSTFSNSIEHGHVVRGWLRFSVPKEDVDLKSLAGTLECRDYLERDSQLLFAADKDNHQTQKRKTGQKPTRRATT